MSAGSLTNFTLSMSSVFAKYSACQNKYANIGYTMRSKHPVRTLTSAPKSRTLSLFTSSPNPYHRPHQVIKHGIACTKMLDTLSTL